MKIDLIPFKTFKTCVGTLVYVPVFRKYIKM